MWNILKVLVLLLVAGMLQGCFGGGMYYVVRSPHHGRIVAVQEVDGYYVYDAVPSYYSRGHSRIVVRGHRYHWSGHRYDRHVPDHRRGHRQVYRGSSRGHHRPALHRGGRGGHHRPAVHRGGRGGHRRGGHRR